MCFHYVGIIPFFALCNVYSGTTTNWMYNEPDHNTVDSNEYNIVTSPFSKIICLTMTIDVQVTFLLITVIVRIKLIQI